MKAGLPTTVAIALALAGLLATTLAPSVAEAARPRPSAPTPLEVRLEAWELHQKLEDDSLFKSLPWRNVGPVVQGGRLVDIDVSPHHPYTFYIAYASGGLWRTSNNGKSFEPLFDHQPTVIMADVAIDPRNPDVVWVGTGENNSSRSSYSGLGVYRSQDGGETWRYMGLGETDRIGRIHIDPRDSRRILVASLGKLYTPGGQRGIYRSTDGGETWTEVLAGDEWTGFVDLVHDPSNPDVVYASAWERSRRPWDFVEGGKGSAIYKSTDAGDTWTRLDGGFPSGEHVGRIGLTLCRSQPRTLYAYVDNQEILPETEWDLGDGAVTPKRLRDMTKEDFLRQDPEEIEDFVRGYDLHPSIDAQKLIEMVEKDEVTIQDLLDVLNDANANLFNTDIRGPQVWRSDDGGASWRLMHEEPIRQHFYTYGYYFGQIRVSPDDPERVYIMGVPMLRSDDGGRSWKSIHQRDVHVDYQAMWIDPSQPERVIVGNDGGLAMSYDGGETWVVLNSTPVGQIYALTLDDAEPYNIYVGMQDNGTWKGSSTSRPGIDEWRRVNGGDGMYIEVDPRDDKTVYSGFQFGYYTRIDADGSRHRTRPRNELKEDALRYNWQTPILLSSHNADILYFGANKLFRSMDQGESWTALSEDLTKSKKRGDVPFGTLTSIDESTYQFGLLWAGTDDGMVHVSVDGGVSWKEVTDGLPRDRWVSRVIASQHEKDVAYVTLNGYRDDDMTAYVYRTDNLGRRWKSLAKGLPAEPVNVIREDPSSADILYVGTDRGVYVTMDQGETWQALQGELPNVPVHDLAVHERDAELVAGTHGRSAWVVDVEPIQKLSDEVQGAVVHLFEIDEIQASRGWRSRRSPWFHRPEFDPEQTFVFWAQRAGQVEVSILDEDDRPLRTMQVEATAGVNTFTWDLLLDEELALAAEQARLAAEEAEESESTEDDDSDAGGDSGAGVSGADTGGDAGDAEDADEPEFPDKGIKAQEPWAEAVRLERPLYVTGGSYQTRLEMDGASHSIDFEVKAPPDREPRVSAPARPATKIGP